MSSSGFILFLDGDGDAGATRWRIASVSVTAPPADVESSPEEVARTLRQMGYRGEGVVLSVPSTWCMAAAIDVDQLAARDYKAMTYRLEEQLPLPAEAVVAAFIVRGGRALAVCARVDPLLATITALEGHGVVVQSVAPTMMLAAQDLARDDEREQLLLLGDGSRVSLVALRNGIATAWALVSNGAGDVALHLDAISLEFVNPPPIRACDLPADVLLALADHGDLQELPPETVERSARRQARRVLEGRGAAWGEMRRGPLAGADGIRNVRKPLNAALAAAAVFLLACSGAMWWRAEQYDHRARASEAAVAGEFRSAFPGWVVPTNVKSVIESERRKALALSGSAAGSERYGSAVKTLHSVLSQLPGDERWTIQRMSFDDGSFEIEGKLRASEALDRFATAVRRTGMSVATPESHKDADGFWSFILRGTRPNATAAARAGED